MMVTAETKFRRQVKLMGSAFEFIIEEDIGRGEELLDAAVNEVKRIEYLLTEFSETSQTTLLNQKSGIQPVKVDAEVYHMILRCKEISALTQGAFDITSGLLKKLYNFKGKHAQFPDDITLRETLSRVGYTHVKLLDGYRVMLGKPGMHISFSAIGKGYAADCVKKMLQGMGVTRGVINASGDLTAWGPPHLDNPWKVGIANPDEPTKQIAWLPVQNASVATSGDYEQYFEFDGIRYSHTIDPKTGNPIKGVKSVTIVSSSAELSDALATAVTVMGVEAGIYLIEQLPGTHCLMVNDQNKIFTSKHIKLSTFNR